MASPIYLLSKKLKQHPWFKTPADCVVTIGILSIGTVVVCYAITFYRDHQIRSNCLAQGGIPVYTTQLPQVMSRMGYVSDGPGYQTFDRCDLGKQKIR